MIVPVKSKETMISKCKVQQATAMAMKGATTAKKGATVATTTMMMKTTIKQKDSGNSNKKNNNNRSAEESDAPRGSHSGLMRSVDGAIGGTEKRATTTQNKKYNPNN